MNAFIVYCKQFEVSFNL